VVVSVLGQYDIRRAHLLATGNELGKLKADLAVVDSRGDHGCRGTDESVRGQWSNVGRQAGLSRTLDHADDLTGATANAVDGAGGSSGSL
jgi:hypothetical protein